LSQVAAGPLHTLTALTETITNQVNVGTVVTTGDVDSGICAFGTIVNINQYKENPGMAGIHSLLRDISKRNPKSTKSITKILAGEDCVAGLMLKERLINFPFELAPNIHKVLIDDVIWSGSDDYEPDDGEKREDYHFTHLLVLSSFEVEGGSKSSSAAVPEESEEGAGEPGMGHKKKRKMDKLAAASARVYHHWEDEVFVEKALFVHKWQNAAKSEVFRANRKYQAHSILYAIRWSDYTELAAKLSLA